MLLVKILNTDNMHVDLVLVHGTTHLSDLLILVVPPLGALHFSSRMSGSWYMFLIISSSDESGFEFLDILNNN